MSTMGQIRLRPVAALRAMVVSDETVAIGAPIAAANAWAVDIPERRPV
jgi:hypothetical protein